MTKRVTVDTKDSKVARSIFQETWWLEAAAGAALEQAEVQWDGQLVAALPFVRSRKLGFTLLEMPPYTRTLGPILTLPESTPAQRMRNMQDIARDLLAAMPRHDRCQMTLGPDDPTAFHLALAGCSLGQQFTFRMPAMWDEDRHWSELDQKTRNLIRTAARDLEVRRDSSFEALLELSERERGEEDRNDRATLRRIAAAAAARAQQATLTAHLERGALVAAATIVWDSQTMYFWQSVRDSRVPHSGANSLLVWEAMRLALEKRLIFDVDGYHSLSAARFVSRFGMQTAVRTSVQHLSRRGRMVQTAGRLFGRGGGFGVQPLAFAPG